MDRVTESLVEALKAAVAAGGERRLHKSGKLDGLFPGRGGPAGEAAARALRDGLLEVTRTETKGKTVIDWVRLTPRGVDFLHEHESPVRALQELRGALRGSREAVPAWLEEMRAGLHALGDRLTEDAHRWQERLEALERRVDEALHRLEAAAPLPSDVAREHPWAADAVNYLDRRRGAGAEGDCPLPELFAALARAHAGLSVSAFHEGLRRLHQRHVLRLRPAGTLLDLPQPEYALLDGGEVFYAVTR